ncbi:MAG: Crp/Fnr family transcriptional regulator [Dyadobacter sp.]|uniref:Crp/Fnr family transcriptional regulator n=1 Tax=Dyadobacter sp. TaxID=1914288 RepID=UPI001B121EDE|nr:Crp/Fnr family transcriptional regulator [Dyadobacter sp.]MBO9612000.1 Crp/Fnr family transcriptional regulator [Dyadobacter sp.]
MTESLLNLCREVTGMSGDELAIVERYLKTVRLKRKQFLIREGRQYDFIGFVVKGAIRHFTWREGVEKTCNVNFENQFFTDFDSFYRGTPTTNNSIALEDSVVLILSKTDRDLLMAECPAFERFSRVLSEHAAQEASERASRLSWDRPEDRYLHLLEHQPDFARRVPLKYLANMLGVSAESLSRIRKRLAHPMFS